MRTSGPLIPDPKEVTQPAGPSPVKDSGMSKHVCGGRAWLRMRKITNTLLFAST